MHALAVKLPKRGSFGTIALAMRNRVPKLPRFNAPKSMTSKVFKTKKDKAKTRRSLKRELAKEVQNED